MSKKLFSAGCNVKELASSQQILSIRVNLIFVVPVLFLGERGREEEGSVGLGPEKAAFTQNFLVGCSNMVKMMIF